jgi:hypothetical protein
MSTPSVAGPQPELKIARLGPDRARMRLWRSGVNRTSTYGVFGSRFAELARGRQPHKIKTYSLNL